MSKVYRGKIVFQANDFSSDKVAKEVGCFPDCRVDQFYLCAFMRANYGNFNKGTKAYKSAYIKASNRLQYLSRLGVVVNVAYGKWQWVGEYATINTLPAEYDRFRLKKGKEHEY